MNIGQYDIDDFVEYPVVYLDELLAKNGFDCIPCFNDYKWVWVCHEKNLTILAHTEIREDDIDGHFEIIDRVWFFNGIYDGP